MSLHKNLSPTPSKAFAAPSDVSPATLEGFSTIASFSWMNLGDTTPTLAIPGEPPKWIEPTLPLCVPPDQGTRYIDHTGDQCEKAGVNRLMPLVQAVEQCSPTFDFARLNLVCNRNNLRNLLRWITGTTQKDFRIDLQLINDKKTLVMLEYEVANTEFVNQGDFRGFGDNFRKKTVRAPSGQIRHNRVVTYKLGHFHVLMAHKVEAHVERGYENSLESLMARIDALDMKDNTPTEEVSPTNREGYLPIQRTSDKVKEYDFTEIKTMAQKKVVNWEDIYPQIYLSQTTSLYAAAHARGQFVAIQKHSANDADLAIYKTRVEKSMGRLLEFLRHLMSALKSSGEGPWALVCTNGNLGLHKSTEDVLPATILSKFGSAT